MPALMRRLLAERAQWCTLALHCTLHCSTLRSAALWRCEWTPCQRTLLTAVCCSCSVQSSVRRVGLSQLHFEAPHPQQVRAEGQDCVARVPRVLVHGARVARHAVQREERAGAAQGQAVRMGPNDPKYAGGDGKTAPTSLLHPQLGQCARLGTVLQMRGDHQLETSLVSDTACKMRRGAVSCTLSYSLLAPSLYRCRWQSSMRQSLLRRLFPKACGRAPVLRQEEQSGGQARLRLLSILHGQGVAIPVSGGTTCRLSQGQRVPYSIRGRQGTLGVRRGGHHRCRGGREQSSGRCELSRVVVLLHSCIFFARVVIILLARRCAPSSEARSCSCLIVAAPCADLSICCATSSSCSYASSCSVFAPASIVGAPSFLARAASSSWRGLFRCCRRSFPSRCHSRRATPESMFHPLVLLALRRCGWFLLRARACERRDTQGDSFSSGGGRPATVGGGTGTMDPARERRARGSARPEFAVVRGRSSSRIPCLFFPIRGPRKTCAKDALAHV